MYEPAKRLQQVARRCLERAHNLELKLFSNHLEVIQTRQHLQRGTAERGYFAAGYLQALKDVRDLIEQGEFPAGRLDDEDGGPRVRIRGEARG